MTLSSAKNNNYTTRCEGIFTETGSSSNSEDERAYVAVSKKTRTVFGGTNSSGHCLSKMEDLQKFTDHMDKENILVISEAKVEHSIFDNFSTSPKTHPSVPLTYFNSDSKDFFSTPAMINRSDRPSTALNCLSSRFKLCRSFVRPSISRVSPSGTFGVHIHWIPPQIDYATIMDTFNGWFDDLKDADVHSSNGQISADLWFSSAGSARSACQFINGGTRRWFNQQLRASTHCK
uniref:Uncharacterized protein n=1 Tax=Ditylenchus dipsaci TaxID=166011 RepID=A0A915EA79_9BILA